MVPQPWLEDVSRRTLKDIKERLEPEAIYALITMKDYPYKYNRDYYRCRDRALMSLLFMCVARVNEVLRLTKKQFDLMSDRQFIMRARVRDFLVSKRKEKTIKKFGQKLIEIPLPKRKRARLYPFTELILDYLAVCKPQKLFRFGRVLKLVFIMPRGILIPCGISQTFQQSHKVVPGQPIM